MSTEENKEPVDTSSKEEKKTQAVPKKTAARKKNSSQKEKVEFLASPTGVLKLAYSAGEVGEVTKEQAQVLYDMGIAKKAK